MTLRTYKEKIEDTIIVLDTMVNILGLSSTEKDTLRFASKICNNYLKSIDDMKYCPHIKECKTFGYGCDGYSYEYCDEPKSRVDDTKGLIRREYNAS